MPKLTPEESEQLVNQAAISSTAMLLFGMGRRYHNPIEDPGYEPLDVIHFLIDRFPVRGRPITIRVGIPPGANMGVIDYDGWQFVMWVDPRLSAWEIRDTLFHEWAHVLAETFNREPDRHGRYWGEWYGQIWDAWHEG